jgi:hypothetical protein
MNQPISDMFAKIKNIRSKLRLRELQLWPNNMAHFPTSESGTDAKKYVKEI